MINYTKVSLTKLKINLFTETHYCSKCPTPKVFLKPLSIQMLLNFFQTRINPDITQCSQTRINPGITQCSQTRINPGITQCSQTLINPGITQCSQTRINPGIT